MIQENSESEGWIVPDWPAPARVRSLISSRSGGVSAAPYASFNVSDHVGDDPLAVIENRRRLARHLPAPPLWLKQVHGATVVDAAKTDRESVPVADAAVARQAGVVCAVMTADCLPVLLCDRSARVVAAVHAGWRGLQAGVLERTVSAVGVPGQQLLAYLGPAIGPQAFEVGEEVRRVFVAAHAVAAEAFTPLSASDGLGGVSDRSVHPREAHQAKWLADIYLLARQAFGRVGVAALYGGGYCTVRDESRFFSYRRDGVTGRMASMIWLSDE